MTLAASEFPRLLAGMPASGALGLRAHETLHGPLSLPTRRRSGTNHPLILELKRAGLRGYGGAGFPTATKLHAVAAQGQRPAVVVNASEGEPLSQKDQLLMRHLPHSVIDGALAVCATLGSDHVVFAIDEGALDAARAVKLALAERPELGRRGRAAVSFAFLPGGYITGQETALLRVLNGGAPKPTTTPPYPFERGLRGRPTLVSNAETFAQIGLVARHGAAWYRALGTESSPGTRLVSVSGAIGDSGVVEAAGGTTLRQLFNAAGGLTEPLQGILLGGYAGTWLCPDEADLLIDEHTIREHDAKLGAGIVFALPQSACVVAEVAGVAGWLHTQSAGQCGPCIHGLAAIADALANLCSEGDSSGAYRQIERWCGLVTQRGACGLPDGAASFVASALHSFRVTFDDHARYGPCDACLTQRHLPTPSA
ncbi:MAG TPA: NADH-ubiquinone oxidoreductase-F iron-sulfur binding region domain-containing protein [Solirubrobacteraceae bacterium]|jgi:NADH:ubiquinone oxidoreductase subunit F (NADH-binding)|nr:NADH-ubiquinone oxidoreductase-F iron-sulfur binding region domain-containing protein [Solirubrobacteraceae bacterium]